MKKLMANLVECHENLSEELAEVFSGNSIFNPKAPKSDIKGLNLKVKKLKRFVKKVATQEGFTPPKLVITSEEDGGAAHGIKNYSALIILSKEEVLNDYRLKQAKSILVHELAHIKNNDPLFSSVFYWAAMITYGCLLYCLLFANLSLKANLLIIPLLIIPSLALKFYNHYTEYRADGLVKKYGLAEEFLNTFDEEDFEEDDCFTHPSTKDRAKKLVP